MKTPYLISAIKVEIHWPTCPWLPGPLWARWRDMTWAKHDRTKYLEKMQGYYDAGLVTRRMAVDRVRKSSGLDDGDVWDFDDNIPRDWAMVLVNRWGLS